MGRKTGRYPVFEALGGQQVFLDDPDEAMMAGRDERVRSIWPFIVRVSRRFHGSLKPRERVNFDPEDIATELWAAIAERDHKWSPERGKYITFAARIIGHALSEIRDRARTVESPRNSSCRMAEYLAEEAEGTITAGRRKTADDIRRTCECAGSLDGGEHDIEIDSGGDSPLAEALAAEDVARNNDALRSALRTLDTAEAAVIGMTSGLWGRETQTVFWAGWMLGIDPADVRRIREAAIAKIRAHLVSTNHPAASDVA